MGRAERIDEVTCSPISCETRYVFAPSATAATWLVVTRQNRSALVAAQSIGEPGTQLTMRTFHIGGVASRTFAADSVLQKNGGTVRLHVTSYT